jgi:hypothetical protein
MNSHEGIEQLTAVVILDGSWLSIIEAFTTSATTDTFKIHCTASREAIS